MLPAPRRATAWDARHTGTGLQRGDAAPSPAALHAGHAVLLRVVRAFGMDFPANVR